MHRSSFLHDSLGVNEGFDENVKNSRQDRLLDYINLQLIAHGLPPAAAYRDDSFIQLTHGLLDKLQSQSQLLSDYRCPADTRIESFLAQYFDDLNLEQPLQLPANTFVIDRHGMARELSLPAGGDEFQTEIVQSYRVRNGVLHNPRHDRRTTKGTFHVAEGGLPIPLEKRAVPKHVAAELFRRALLPPQDLTRLPYTSNQEEQAHCFVSLMLRPIVCPEVLSVTPVKSMEVRFFVPGTLVSNLDFVESIFGNAGDPQVPQNDAGLDVEHWTGHTGAVILAPHLEQLTKKELGLPPYSEATERQRRDEMCWKDEQELYNGGQPFKLTCRDASGVIVTVISDNYFGYCKKEVKTQISYAANLSGNYEEEHAGGAIAFASYNLGDEFQFNSVRYNGRTFADVVADYGTCINVFPEGYGQDREYPDLIYVREDARADINSQKIVWTHEGVEQAIPLLPGKVYMGPSGYQLRMEKHPMAPTWRLVGTVGEGVLCHKPCTVSGGGKSEISKSIRDYMHFGPLFVVDYEHDMQLVNDIFDRDYQDRWKVASDHTQQPSRRVLSPLRSLGSVIKLFTPSPEYSDEYNAWLNTIPSHVFAIVFMIKRFYRQEWGSNWIDHFNVDVINGEPGHELKYRDRPLVGTYLKVGFANDHTWRTFKVRQDFIASEKIQVEDDITASIVVPADQLSNPPRGVPKSSYKFVQNCEYRFFQRPDDAIHRGLDKQAEYDLSQSDNFISNFEPLSHQQVAEMAKYVVDFDAFSAPMQKILNDVLEHQAGYVVCSANPRQVDGRPTKNPRYLQVRPDLVQPMTRYVSEMGTRLARALPIEAPVQLPVGAVLIGRRNNPPDPSNGIRGLAVYNPIHYQEIPELFMDLITSLTGRSPSTTGFGSEGALTKGPFNSLRMTADLNAALVSFILTELPGFSTAAGHIGPNIRVDHDISLLIPEVWSRMTPDERETDYLLEHGYMEPVQDFEHNGTTIPAHRLGYRITNSFVRHFFGRVFDSPNKLFDELILQPERQDIDAFADGVLYIVDAQRRVAQQYLDDGSIDDACPPLRALLMIMANGEFEGMTESHPDFRNLFTRESLLQSSWYQDRLEARQQRDVKLWSGHVNYVNDFLSKQRGAGVVSEMELAKRAEFAQQQLETVSSPEYVESLIGTIGTDRYDRTVSPTTDD
ncbi:hypothetical protein Mal52_58640 [Symmachiella dynata]|uniref:PPi-type phosphoenolpyruvate carboxykinase lobe 2 domain-containing protein n=1 Tax=Symmachiella dynata TaxID=2527995 RepID=A0A517ZY05_9PLAN|nr:hypothetical protein [Symmachiella dynata]QDU47335.1 hypothetical protein Mal52_58640 [Symmachiella dynata]